MYRYNVHFGYTDDIEVSVIVCSETQDEFEVASIARDKLYYNGLDLVVSKKNQS